MHIVQLLIRTPADELILEWRKSPVFMKPEIMLSGVLRVTISGKKMLF